MLCGPHLGVLQNYVPMQNTFCTQISQNLARPYNYIFRSILSDIVMFFAKFEENFTIDSCM